MNKLVVSNINKSYDKKNLVLKDVSFSIQEGTFVVIVGPSGCGKSTLLSVIAGSYYQILEASMFIWMKTVLIT